MKGKEEGGFQRQQLICDAFVIKDSANSMGSSRLTMVLQSGPKLYPTSNSH